MKVTAFRDVLNNASVAAGRPTSMQDIETVASCCLSGDIDETLCNIPMLSMAKVLSVRADRCSSRLRQVDRIDTTPPVLEGLKPDEDKNCFEPHCCCRVDEASSNL